MDKGKGKGSPMCSSAGKGKGPVGSPGGKGSDGKGNGGNHYSLEQNKTNVQKLCFSFRLTDWYTRFAARNANGQFCHNNVNRAVINSYLGSMQAVYLYTKEKTPTLVDQYKDWGNYSPAGELLCEPIPFCRGLLKTFREKPDLVGKYLDEEDQMEFSIVMDKFGNTVRFDTMDQFCERIRELTEPAANQFELESVASSASSKRERDLELENEALRAQVRRLTGGDTGDDMGSTSQ